MIYENNVDTRGIILLIEDNPAHAELVTRSLEEQELANVIYHVADGEAALDYVFRRGIYADPSNSPRPQVILLDLRLPKVDGLEVLKAIKMAPGVGRIPIVILSTSAADQDLNRAYEYSANSYLVKPVDFEKFTRLISHLSAYWLEWNQCPGLTTNESNSAVPDK